MVTSQSMIGGMLPGINQWELLLSLRHSPHMLLSLPPGPARRKRENSVVCECSSSPLRERERDRWGKIERVNRRENGMERKREADRQRKTERDRDGHPEERREREWREGRREREGERQRVERGKEREREREQ